MNLEDLVPPLDLCKRIPAGRFDDSALVYATMWAETEPFVAPRCAANDNAWDIAAPAPTLAEIMDALRNNGVMLRGEVDGSWSVVRWEKLNRFSCNDCKSATAALRLWLEVEGIEA